MFFFLDKSHSFCQKLGWPHWIYNNLNNIYFCNWRLHSWLNLPEWTILHVFSTLFSTCLPCRSMQQSTDPCKRIADNVCSWLMNHNIGEEESVSKVCNIFRHGKYENQSIFLHYKLSGDQIIWYDLKQRCVLSILWKHLRDI